MLETKDIRVGICDICLSFCPSFDHKYALRYRRECLLWWTDYNLEICKSEFLQRLYPDGLPPNESNMFEGSSLCSVDFVHENCDILHSHVDCWQSVFLSKFQQVV